MIDVRRPFRVAWTGGSPDAVVQMRLIAYRDQERILARACDCRVVASEGAAELDLAGPPGR